MPARRIGDIIRRLFWNLKPAAIGSGQYEWRFERYGRPVWGLRGVDRVVVRREWLEGGARS